MPARTTRTSAMAGAGESRIPTSTSSLGAGKLGVSGLPVASKLSLPATRKKKDIPTESIASAISQGLSSPVNLKYGRSSSTQSGIKSKALELLTFSFLNSGSVSSQPSSQAKSLLTNALTKAARNSPNKTVVLGSKRSTPCKGKKSTPSKVANSNKTTSQVTTVDSAPKTQTPPKLANNSKKGPLIKEPEIVDLSDDEENEVPCKTPGSESHVPSKVVSSSGPSKLSGPSVSSYLNATPAQSIIPSSAKLNQLKFTKEIRETKRDVAKTVKPSLEVKKADLPHSQTTTLGKEEMEQLKLELKKTKVERDEKAAELKHLEVKIPKMIAEFQKFQKNKEFLKNQNDQKIQELTLDMNEKDKKLSDLTTDVKKLKQKMADYGREKEELMALNTKLKNDVVKKVSDSKQSKDLQKESELKIKELEEELKMKISEVATVNKKFVEVNNLRLESDVNAKKKQQQLDKINVKFNNMKKELESKESKLKKQDDDLKSLNDSLTKSKEEVNSMKKELESRESKLKKQDDEHKNLNVTLIKSKEEVSSMRMKITFLETDLQMNCDLVKTKEEELVKCKELFTKQEEQLTKKEAELKAARQSMANFSKLQTEFKSLMVNCEQLKKVIDNKDTVIGQRDTDIANAKRYVEKKNLEIEKYKTQTQSFSNTLNQLKVRSQQQTQDMAQMKAQKCILDQELAQLKHLKESLDKSLLEKCQENDFLRKELTGKKEEVTLLKATQVKLYGQINELELTNFNRKESLETQLKTMKELKKRSVQCVSLMRANQEYSRMIKSSFKIHVEQNNKPREEEALVEEEMTTSLECEDIPESEHVQEMHNPESTSQVKFPDNMIQFDWPILLWVERPQMILNNSDRDHDSSRRKRKYQEEEDLSQQPLLKRIRVIIQPDNSSLQRGISILFPPFDLLQDLETEATCDAPIDSAKENSDSISYPNNMITYLYPIALFPVRKTVQVTVKFHNNLLKLLALNVDAMNDSMNDFEEETIATVSMKLEKKKSDSVSYPDNMITYLYPIALFPGRKTLRLLVNFHNNLLSWLALSFDAMNDNNPKECQKEARHPDNILKEFQEARYPDNMICYNWPVIPMRKRSDCVITILRKGKRKLSVDDDDILPLNKRIRLEQDLVSHHESVGSCKSEKERVSLSYPDNMLTYLYPVALYSQRTSGDVISIRASIILEAKLLPAKQRTFSGLKRKREADNDQISFNKKIRPREPKSMLALSYNWPVALLRPILSLPHGLDVEEESRGQGDVTSNKRKLPEEFILQDEDHPKRFKMDRGRGKI